MEINQPCDNKTDKIDQKPPFDILNLTVYKIVQSLIFIQTPGQALWPSSKHSLEIEYSKVYSRARGTESQIRCHACHSAVNIPKEVNNTDVKPWHWSTGLRDIQVNQHNKIW